MISSGLMLLVYGEAHFDGVGFALVMTASALSGLRWTITQVLLQGGARGGAKVKESSRNASSKTAPASSSSVLPASPTRSPSAAEAGTTSGGGGGGDHGHGGQGPVAVVAALMPVMALTVAFVSLLAERLWAVLPHSPYFDSLNSVMLTLGLVAGGAAIAFMMVWVEFTVIKLTSALTFMVAGTFKEIVTVLAAVAFLGESFSRINAAGLGVLVAGVALFNWTKYRKVAAEQREAEAAAEIAAATSAVRASSQNDPSSLSVSAYETFVPSSSSSSATNNNSGGSDDLNGTVVVERGGAAAAAAARKRRGGGLGGVGDGGASLDFEAPPLHPQLRRRRRWKGRGPGRRLRPRETRRCGRGLRGARSRRGQATEAAASTEAEGKEKSETFSLGNHFSCWGRNIFFPVFEPLP